MIGIWFRISSCVMMVGVIGCGNSEVQLTPVKGTVSYRGKPIPKAEIAFHPQMQGPGWIPIAIVNDDGTFAASTKRPGDGAIPGKYKVTIVWKPTANEDGEGPNFLPPRYSQLATTPLEIEVQADESAPHELQLTD